MTNDLVTRLREAHRTADEVASVFLTAEAVDEIERLRAELAKVTERYPSKSGQVSSHGWRMFRKWHWKVHDYGDYSANEGYCFTKKNAYKKAGMGQ